MSEHEKVHVICENLCLEEGMTKEQIEHLVGTVASGSPKGVYVSAEALKTANPDTGVYVITANGHVYSWTKNSTGNPIDLGVYQSSGIEDDSITISKLSYEMKENSYNLLNYVEVYEKKLWTDDSSSTVTSDNLSTSSAYNSFKPIEVVEGAHYKLLREDGMSVAIHQLIEYDTNGDYVQMTTIPALQDYIVPTNVKYIKISSRRVSEAIQFKRTDIPEYTPNFEPYKYQSIYEKKEDVKKITNSISNITWEDDKYIFKTTGEARHDAYSSPYSASDFIPIKQNELINFKNIYISGNTVIGLYNQNKEFINTVESSSAITNTSHLVENDECYMRVTCYTVNKKFVEIWYSNYRTLEHDDRLDEINSNLNINVENFLKTINSTPIATWIDDDTAHLSSINNVKNICDSLGIKATFACITGRLDDNRLNRLKELQEAGFHVTTHTHTHTKGTATDPFWYPYQYQDIAKCEQDLIKSLNLLNENGFLDSNYFVSPGGNLNNDLMKMVMKWCKCGVGADNGNGINHKCGEGKEKIHRVFIRPVSEGGKTLAEYQALIDTAYDNGDWIVFGTHSGIETQWDETLVENVLQYAITKGFDFQTLNQAWHKRKFNYDVYEMFN